MTLILDQDNSVSYGGGGGGGLSGFTDPMKMRHEADHEEEEEGKVEALGG